MCGIAGGFALAPDARPSEARVRAMTELVAHRGPDGLGLWCSHDHRAVFGHRRLAVIDVAGGRQPMSSGDGHGCITFNGEVYNYRELRLQLAQRGQRFATDSDTEVILELLRVQWQEGLSQLRGMFALAVHDAERGELLLARDRLGKKPLFYAVEGDCLYFGSSLHALRHTSPSPWTFDVEAAHAYLSLGYIPAPRTIWREARKLEASTFLRAAGSQLHTGRYWDVAGAACSFEGPFAAALDRAEEILTEAVTLRLRSDVPLGVLLSGGIDSSLVAAVAKGANDQPLRTFTIGFDERGYDESSIAAAVARHLRTEHSTFQVRSEALGLLPEFVRHFGEPFGDSSALALWALARETRQHVTVALTGDGGDEGFAGYPWYRTAARLGRVHALLPGPFRAAAASVAAAGRHVAPVTAGRVSRGLRLAAGASDAARYDSLRALFGGEELIRLTAGDLQAIASDAGRGGVTAHAFGSVSGSALHRMRYSDVKTYLADGLMPKADVASMAHALELRSPLLDQALLRFAFTLPDDYLMDRHGGKRILRALVARHLPRELFARPKQGFTPPVAAWFRDPSSTIVSQLANSESLRATGWLNMRAVEGLIAEHVSGDRDHGERLFALLVLHQWLMN